VIVVGGESDPVPVHLEDGPHIYVCRAKRQIAQALAAQIFALPVRVEGQGRWFRDALGTWVMKSFHIASFVVLDDTTLSQVIATLRHVPAAWTDRPNALTTLKALRNGDD
jgi:hypothetical protein